jgi:oxalate---CoA ligase
LITLFAEKQGLKRNGKDGDKVSRKQNVDDAYCAYVYSLIVKQPSIIIGTVPPGTPPVWIAPTPAKRGEGKELLPPVSLRVIEGAKEKSMQELKETYGSTLRIAADKMSCFVAITGSHNRV